MLYEISQLKRVPGKSARQGVGVLLTALFLASAVGCQTGPPPRPTSVPPTATARATATSMSVGVKGIGWVILITDSTCEWSGIDEKAICWGVYPKGHRVRFIAPEGPRVKIWEPDTQNYAYVDRTAIGIHLPNG